MKVYIILPCYNEESALPCLFDSIRNLLNSTPMNYEIVIVNDGSTDGTEDIAMKWSNILNIKILNHRINMGLGRGINTAFTYFNEHCSDDDAAVIMDADNTHNPDVIPSMLERINRGNDVVIASRYETGGEEIGLSFTRKECSFFASKLLSLFFKIPNVKDYTCGYRTYTGSIIKKAYETFGNDFIEESGFTCMAEVIIKLHFLCCEISEVPLKLRYDFKKGKSKMKIIKTILRYFVLIYKCKHSLHQQVPVFTEGKVK